MQPFCRTNIEKFRALHLSYFNAFYIKWWQLPLSSIAASTRSTVPVVDEVVVVGPAVVGSVGVGLPVSLIVVVVP